MWIKNSVDHDQKVSDGVGWSEATPFTKHGLEFKFMDFPMGLLG